MILKRFLYILMTVMMFHAFSIASAGEKLEISKDRIVIVLSEKESSVLGNKKAANELKRHLELITEAPVKQASTLPEGSYGFFIGVPAPGDETAQFAAEESRWAVTEKGVYFYGSKTCGGQGFNGAFYAVCDFLEEQLGVRWIQPGDIAFRKQDPLKLEVGKGIWKTAFIERFLWSGVVAKSSALPVEAREFAWADSECQGRITDTHEWKGRMRVDKFISWDTTHAFGLWWKKYGKDYPDYFALNGKNSRAPLGAVEDKNNPAAAVANNNNNSREDIQLCVSNPKVAERVISDYLERKPRPANVNITNNDSVDTWCRCEECRKLDTVEPKGEMPDLTDRYINFANRVTQLAQKVDPALKVHTMAYNETELPPRREKFNSNNLLTYVPTDFRTEKISPVVDGWIKAGAATMRVRPNMHHYMSTGALPLGFEKHMYDMIHAMTKYPEFVGFNFDSLMHRWAVTGFADYVLAKSISDPEKSFDHWENHYLDAFGPAKEDMRQYFRYWRKNWDEKLYPDYGAIVERGRWYNFARGLAMAPEKYYRMEDFASANVFLEQALKRELQPGERLRIENFKIANDHAALVFAALAAKGADKFVKARELLDFRRKHKDWRGVPLADIVNLEMRWGDITGGRTAGNLSKFDLPVIETPVSWFFKMDPENVGVSEKWFETPWKDVSKWDIMGTHIFWENAYNSAAYKKIGKKLKDYDGHAWYAQMLDVPADWKDRRVLLYFGGVDESCWVYVNGKLAGEHLFKKRGDESEPFSIDITELINWQKPSILVQVRVEDLSGVGGIYGRVYLVSQKNNP